MRSGGQATTRAQDGLAERFPRGVQYLDRRLVGLDHPRVKDSLEHQLDQGAELLRALGHPAAERAPRQENAVAGQHVLLTWAGLRTSQHGAARPVVPRGTGVSRRRS